MGRPKLTAELRVSKLDEATRVQLLVLLARRADARGELEEAERALAEAITKAVEGEASYRDVAACLGLPHQTVHQLVRPYARSR